MSAGLPVPIDDGAARHLVGMAMPPVGLPSTAGRMVRLDHLGDAPTVLYCYPRTGRPGEEVPEAWDAIPGARGCTPQNCNWRDHYAELRALGAGVFGVSAQSTGHQREMAERLHLPYEVLSDSDFRLADALRLPTFEFEGERLLKRLTLIVTGGRVEACFYPIFPSDADVPAVLAWLRR